MKTDFTLYQKDNITKYGVTKRIKFNPSAQSWGGNKGAEWFVRIDHKTHMLYIDEDSACPDIYDFISFIANDKDMKQEIAWSVTNYERTYPFWVDSYNGLSGCIAAEIRYSGVPNWMRKYKKAWKKGGGIYISCFDKVHQIYSDGERKDETRNQIFIPDLLELLDNEYNFGNKYYEGDIKKKGYKYLPIWGNKIPKAKTPRFGKYRKEVEKLEQVPLYEKEDL